MNEVWWIISPKNPLKADYSFNYTKRLEACRKLLNKSNIKLSEVEKITGSYYSSDTIKILKKKNLIEEGYLDPPKGEDNKNWKKVKRLIFNKDNAGANRIKGFNSQNVC